MTNSSSVHPKEKRGRHPKGWQYGEPVIEYLNSPRRDPGREHVTYLLRTLRKLKEDDHPPVVRRSLQVMKAVLPRYTQRPICFVGKSQGKSIVAFEMEPVGGASAREQRTVNAIFALNERGLLEQLRRCRSKRCGKWLYGKKYCNDACRKAHERSSRKYREYQRKKQSEYYALKKKKALKYRNARRSVRYIAKRLQVPPQRVEGWFRRNAKERPARAAASV